MTRASIGYTLGRIPHKIKITYIPSITKFYKGTFKDYYGKKGVQLVTNTREENDDYYLSCLPCGQSFNDYDRYKQHMENSHAH